MADIYTRMKATADRLLRPASSDGGFGQGSVVITRTVQGVPDPSTPWIEPTPATQTETLKAAVSGASEYADGVTILNTDLRVIAAVPEINWRMGGADEGVLSMTVDSRPVVIVRARGIPEAGNPACVEFIVRN